MDGKTQGDRFMNERIWWLIIGFFMGIFLGMAMGIYFMDAPLTGVCG
jgi:hypothetical protein